MRNQIVLHTESRVARLFEINVVRRDPVTSTVISLESIMKLSHLILVLLFTLPAILHGQSISSGGGAKGQGRNFGGGGGSPFLALRAVNRFPEDQSVGFAYGITNQKRIAYLVCFQNAGPKNDVVDGAFAIEVSVTDRNGHIKQTGAIGKNLVNLAYSATQRPGAKLPVETFKIDDTDFNFQKGRVFVVSESIESNVVHQYKLDILNSNQVDNLLTLIQQVSRNPIGAK